MLQFMGLQRIEHTERLNSTEVKVLACFLSNMKKYSGPLFLNNLSA